MAFLEHIDPGNSGGSVPAPTSPFEGCKPKPVVFVCPVCSHTFDKLEQMRDHRIQAHPLKRPYLLIDGNPSRPEEVIHHPLKQGSLTFEDTLSASLDDIK